MNLLPLGGTPANDNGEEPPLDPACRRLHGRLPIASRRDLWSHGPMRKSIFVFLAVFAGCVRTTTVIGPNGTPAYHIACGNYRYRCLEEASKLCPAGYAVLDAQTNAAGAVVTSTTITMINNSEML